MSPLIESLRPRHWVKNLVVLVPLFFSGQLLEPGLLSRGLMGVFLFIAISGAVYLINDLFDLATDRKLPPTLQRPLAARTLSSRTAIVAIIGLVLIGLSYGFRLEWQFGWMMLLYLFIQIGYSAGLKLLVPLDIFIIAVGFVLRVIGGQVLLELPSSPWLFIGTFFVALFLALSKRFIEAVLWTKRGIRKRSPISLYELETVRGWLQISAATVLVTYAMYSIDGRTIGQIGNETFVYSIVLVAFGLFRYLWLLYRFKPGEVLYRTIMTDRLLALAVLLWLVFTGSVIYG